MQKLSSKLKCKSEKRGIFDFAYLPLFACSALVKRSNKQMQDVWKIAHHSGKNWSCAIEIELEVCERYWF